MKNVFLGVYLSALFLLLFSACSDDNSPVEEVNTPDTEHQVGISNYKVHVAGGQASSFQSSAPFENSYDGNYETIYHSNWENGTVESNPNYFPITLDYYFNNEPLIEYFIYHPRKPGYAAANKNGFFKDIEVWAQTGNDTKYTKLLDKNMGGSSKATRVMFPKPLTNVKSIRIVVKSGEGDRQGFASCAEMEFYKSSFNTFSLFKDLACTQLKDGVTLEEIEECPSPLFKNMAKAMYQKMYPSEFRIAEYKAYPHPKTEAQKNKTSRYSLLDNPTGIYVKGGEELIVLVENLEGSELSLRIQNLNVPNGDGFNAPEEHNLLEGINKLIPTKSGLIYIMYHRTDFKTAPAIKVHIPTGTVNGYYDSTRHTVPNDWNRLLSGATNDYFDVLGKYAHLTFPTSCFREYTGNRGKELIDIYDQIVYLQMKHMGLEKYNCMFNNRLYFHVIYTSYMYSGSYHTAYHNNTMPELCNPDRLKTSSIWGPAHEVGHANQTRPGFRWAGMTEVSNNLHSMYVQRAFGNETRLQTEALSGHEFTNRYEKAMNKYFRDGAAYHSIEVFCKLVPLWQLQLYMSDAQGNDDFYKDLYQLIRTEPDKETNGEHQLEFVVRASKAAKMNLTRFFERWGFFVEVNESIDDYGTEELTITKKMVEEVKKRVQALGYPEPEHRFEYICDNNMKMYQTKQPVKQGTAVRNDKSITLKGWENAVAFEVRDNTRLIFVSPESTFTISKDWEDKFKVFAISSTGQEVEVKF